MRAAGLTAFFVLSSMSTPSSPSPPAPLVGFLPTRADALPAEQAAKVGAVLRKIPPPPRALRQLVSADFIEQASAADMADLVMGEPLVAAKVLAAVNSPVYGLRQPVASVSQAITFLGTGAVRTICLRHMTNLSFKNAVKLGRRVLDTLDTLDAAGGIAGALCMRLARPLRLPDADALATRVVISFVGHLAATIFQGVTNAPEDAVAAGPLLLRLRLQEMHWGMSAGALGQLLLREWQLPPELAEESWALESVLYTPLAEAPPRQAAAMAVGYLCARLGERLACGLPMDPKALDEAFAQDPDLHHVRGYITGLPELAALPALLHDPRTMEGLAG